MSGVSAGAALRAMRAGERGDRELDASREPREGEPG